MKLFGRKKLTHEQLEQEAAQELDSALSRAKPPTDSERTWATPETNRRRELDAPPPAAAAVAPPVGTGTDEVPVAEPGLAPEPVAVVVEEHAAVEIDAVVGGRAEPVVEPLGEAPPVRTRRSPAPGQPARARSARPTRSAPAARSTAKPSVSRTARRAAPAPATARKPKAPGTARTATARTATARTATARTATARTRSQSGARARASAPAGTPARARRNG